MIFETIKSDDKHHWNFDEALHYFEPDESEDGNPSLYALMAKLLPWLAERFPL